LQERRRRRTRGRRASTASMILSKVCLLPYASKHTLGRVVWIARWRKTADEKHAACGASVSSNTCVIVRVRRNDTKQSWHDRSCPRRCKPPFKLGMFLDASGSRSRDCLLLLRYSRQLEMRSPLWLLPRGRRRARGSLCELHSRALRPVLAPGGPSERNSRCQDVTLLTGRRKAGGWEARR